MKNLADLKWPQRIVSISWHSHVYDGIQIVFNFVDFPNVQLMGSRGCINYNPIISLPQLGYQMLDKYENMFLKSFLLHEGVEVFGMLRKIIISWGESIENENSLAGRTLSPESLSPLNRHYNQNHPRLFLSLWKKLMSLKKQL